MIKEKRKVDKMPLISVIVPVKQINNYLRREIIPALKGQTFKHFELIIVPDKKPKKEKLPTFVRLVPSYPLTGPADKRDSGVKKARGEILAFLDDDAYPEKNWLRNAVPYFKNPQIAGVCGPGITPPKNNLKQKVSGFVWQTWLGAGGNTYRCKPAEKREVDDYPTFNLIIRKRDFEKVGGFDSQFWPGEDTKLCHDLVYKLKKKIIYDPKILVFHHRRPIFIPHLKQIARFGLHRGFFTKILPKTSLRIGYFIPLFFVIWLFSVPILKFLSPFYLPPLLFLLYLLSLLVYLLLILITTFNLLTEEKDWKAAFLLIPAIISTHLVYGVMFAKGLLVRKLKR